LDFVTASSRSGAARTKNKKVAKNREDRVPQGAFRGFDRARLLVEASLLFASILATMFPQTAVALPSYARQTGLGCGMCHTEFPQLTPFGRRFKILGYTLGRSVPEDKRVLGNTQYPTKDQFPPDPTLPVSVQAIATFTHTGADQNIAGSAPNLKPNDNVEFQTASIFYGGAITDHIGAYAQFTYNAQPFGPPVPHLFTWDNLDIRYADTMNIAGMPLVYASLQTIIRRCRIPGILRRPGVTRL
jgi:hypothetical protein